MNEEMKYEHLIKAQALAHEMTWQGEDETHRALTEYLRRADEFAKNYVMTDDQIKMISDLQNSLDNRKPTLVRVYGDWYEVWAILLDVKVIALKTKTSGDKVFIWEVKDYVCR